MAIIYIHSICAGMRLILSYAISHHARASCSYLCFKTSPGRCTTFHTDGSEFNLQANQRAIRESQFLCDRVVHQDWVWNGGNSDSEMVYTFLFISFSAVLQRAEQKSYQYITACAMHGTVSFIYQPNQCARSDWSISNAPQVSMVYLTNKEA